MSDLSEAYRALQAAVDGAPLGTALDWAGIAPGQVADIANARGWHAITDPIDLAILLRAFCRARIAARVATGEIAPDHAAATRDIEDLIADGRRFRALDHRAGGWYVTWDAGTLLADEEMENIAEAMEDLNGSPERMDFFRAAVDRRLANLAAAERQTSLDLRPDLS